MLGSHSELEMEAAVGLTFLIPQFLLLCHHGARGIYSQRSRNILAPTLIAK